MAEANALGLTMLQYCEISRICSMGFENNLQEDIKFLQELQSYDCLHLYSSDHFSLLDLTPGLVSKRFNITCTSTIKWVQSYAGFIPFSLKQLETNLYCFRLIHAKQINHLNRESNISITEPNQAKYLKTENVLHFFIISHAENETRIFLKIKMSLI